jgi:hypothetical protein
LLRQSPYPADEAASLERIVRMPPFVVPPLVKWTLVALGGAAMVHWVVREVRRANAELDRARVRVRVTDRERRPSLRFDPETGEYRPQ